MVFASGFVELDSRDAFEMVKEQLDKRQIIITAFEGDKITFLIEKEDSRVIRDDLESMKEINGIRGVYLAYFSLNHSDED